MDELSPTPTLGPFELHGDNACSYGFPVSCGEPGKWHITWDSQVDDHSFACDKHAALAKSHCSEYDRHPLTPDCGMPDTLYVFSWTEAPGYCVWDPESAEGRELVVAMELGQVRCRPLASTLTD